MRNVLRNRLSMLQRVLALFDGRPDLWTRTRKLTDQVALIREGAADLTAAAEDQSAGNPAGLTRDKRDARNRAEALLASLGDAAGAHALVSGDDDFRVATDISQSEWDKKADADFFADAETALARMEGALGDLAEYDVTPEELAEARAAVEAARPLGAGRDVRKAGRTRATAALDGGYSAIVPALTLLDKLVRRLVKDAAFVAEYRVVRCVTDG